MSSGFGCTGSEAQSARALSGRIFLLRVSDVQVMISGCGCTGFEAQSARALSGRSGYGDDGFGLKVSGVGVLGVRFRCRGFGCNVLVSDFGCTGFEAQSARCRVWHRREEVLRHGM